MAGEALFCLQMAEILGFNERHTVCAKRGRQFVSQLGALAERKRFEL